MLHCNTRSGGSSPAIRCFTPSIRLNGSSVTQEGFRGLRRIGLDEAGSDCGRFETKHNERPLREKRFDKRPLVYGENAVPIKVSLLPDDLG